MSASQKRPRKFSPLHPRYWAVAFAAVALMLVFTLPRLNVLAQDATEAAEATQTAEASVAAIVADANTFLDSLDDAQRAAVMFDFNDTAQRNNWSNFPTGAFNRAGLSYTSLTEDQRTKVLDLLQVALSQEGYEKLMGAMVGDEVLGQTENNQSMFGYGLYFVSFLGTPSETDPWILQWGGHHYALNITFAGSNEILTPTHTGCQPCTYIVNDQEVDVLGDEYTKAQALMNALDADQQATAVLDYAVGDLVLGPGEEDRVLEPEGLPGSDMTAEQQTLLVDVISEWVGIANESAAAVRMAELEANINDTYFAWSGDVAAANGAYFRITGPTVLIEFSPQSLGAAVTPSNFANSTSDAGAAGGGAPPNGGNGGPPVGSGFGGNDAQATSEASSLDVYTNTFSLDLGDFEIVNDATALYHVHTIYRDPTNAYGAAVTGQ